MEFTNPDFFTYVRGNEGRNNIKVDTQDYSFLERCLVNSSKTGDINMSLSEIGFENKNEKKFTLLEKSKIYDMFSMYRDGLSKIGYEEDGMSDEEIEEYKKEMIKLDPSLVDERSKLIDESRERNITVIRSDSISFYHGGEYKLYDAKKAFCPKVIDGKLMISIECAQAIGLTVKSNSDSAEVSCDGAKATVKLIDLESGKYLPLRETFENLSYNVLWTESGNVIIYSEKYNFDKSTLEKYAYKLY